jgi:plastocyanin
VSFGLSKKSGSLAVGLTVSLLIVVFVAGIGFYQFVYYPSHQPPTTSSTTFAGKTIQINMTIGAASKTTDAYAPNPVKLVINVNNSIVFYNADALSGGVAHTATSRPGSPQQFDTGTLLFGTKSLQIILRAPGNYSYFCQIHPTTMRGTIVVLAGGVTASSTISATSQSSSRSSASSSPVSAAQAPLFPFSSVASWYIMVNLFSKWRSGRSCRRQANLTIKRW